MDDTSRSWATPPAARLSRKEWSLVALGLLTWLAIAATGIWFVRQVTQDRAACAPAADAPTHQVKGATAGPGNAFQAITGQGRCK